MFNCMRTAEVQFSKIKLIWSAKYFLERWDGGRWTVLLEYALLVRLNEIKQANNDVPSLDRPLQTCQEDIDTLTD